MGSTAVGPGAAAVLGHLPAIAQAGAGSLNPEGCSLAVRNRQRSGLLDDHRASPGGRHSQLRRGRVDRAIAVGDLAAVAEAVVGGLGEEVEGGLVAVGSAAVRPAAAAVLGHLPAIAQAGAGRRDAEGCGFAVCDRNRSGLVGDHGASPGGRHSQLRRGRVDRGVAVGNSAAIAEAVVRGLGKEVEGCFVAVGSAAVRPAAAAVLGDLPAIAQVRAGCLDLEGCGFAIRNRCGNGLLGDDRLAEIRPGRSDVLKVVHKALAGICVLRGDKNRIGVRVADIVRVVHADLFLHVSGGRLDVLALLDLGEEGFLVQLVAGHADGTGVTENDFHAAQIVQLGKAVGRHAVTGAGPEHAVGRTAVHVVRNRGAVDKRDVALDDGMVVIAVGAIIQLHVFTGDAGRVLQADIGRVGLLYVIVGVGCAVGIHKHDAGALQLGGKRVNRCLGAVVDQAAAAAGSGQAAALIQVLRADVGVESVVGRHNCDVHVGGAAALVSVGNRLNSAERFLVRAFDASALELGAHLRGVAVRHAVFRLPEIEAVVFKQRARLVGIRRLDCGDDLIHAAGVGLTQTVDALLCGRRRRSLNTGNRFPEILRLRRLLFISSGDGHNGEHQENGQEQGNPSFHTTIPPN